MHETLGQEVWVRNYSPLVMSMCKLLYCHVCYWLGFQEAVYNSYSLYEPHHEKAGFLPM